MKLLRFLSFFLAAVLVLKDAIQILVKNLLSVDENVTHLLVDSVQIGGIALCIVALSIFFKRNIWAYVFFIVLLVSFSEVLAFTNFTLSISFGSLKIELISLDLLILHVVVNGHLLRIPDRIKEPEEELNHENVEAFMNRLDKKSDEELLRMNEADLVPDAIEARKILMEKRSL